MASDNEMPKRGRPRKLDDFHRFVFRVPTKLYDRLVARAEDQDISLNDFLIMIVSDWVRSNPKKNAQ